MGLVDWSTLAHNVIVTASSAPVRRREAHTTNFTEIVRGVVENQRQDKYLYINMMSSTPTKGENILSQQYLILGTGRVPEVRRRRWPG